MRDLAEIQSLMEQVGDVDEAIVAVAQVEDEEWAVSYDDVVVMLAFVPDRQQLVLSTELGRCPEPRRLSVYTALLNYSVLWRDTGGVRMGLGGDDGEAIQLFDLNVEGLTKTDFAIVLANFAEKARIWRNYVQSSTDGAAPEDAEPFGMRV